MLIHVRLCDYVLCCLVVCIQVVYVLCVAVKDESMSDELCCRVASTQGIILAGGSGLNDDSFRGSTVVNDSPIEENSEAGGALAGLYLSGQINISLT
jgi:hypothetical protein